MGTCILISVDKIIHPMLREVRNNHRQPFPYIEVDNLVFNFVIFCQNKRRKVMNSTEMDEISNNIEKDCQKINENYNLGKVEKYTSTESRKARNTLIAAATTRMPRRTKELLSSERSKNSKENRQFYLVCVLHHKTNSTGDPAIIVYK